MRQKKSKEQPPNLYDLRPQRTLQWEEAEKDRVVLLVPKFRNRFVVRHFVPLLAKPNIRVRLDEIGSFVWRQCDGTVPVWEVAQRTRERFGGEEEEMNSRVAMFVQRLLHDQFLSVI